LNNVCSVDGNVANKWAHPDANNVLQVYTVLRILAEKEVPQAVQKILEEEKGLHPGKIDLAVSSDINEKGQFGEQWLVVGMGGLYVLGANNLAARILYSFRLDEVDVVRSYPVVGGQVLEIRAGDDMREVMHYSNAVADRFGLALKLINFRLRHPDRQFDEGWIGEELRKINKSRALELSTAEKHEVARRLFGLARPYLAACAVMFALLLLGVGVDLLPPYLTKILVDDVLGASAGHPEWLLWLVLALLGLRIVRIGITVGNNRLSAVIGSRFVFNLRAILFEKLQRLPINFFDRKQVGGLMTRVSGDTSVLQGFISNISQGFLLNIVMIIGIGAALFSMNWRLGFFVLLPGPFVVLITRKYWKYIFRFYNRYWFSSYRINSFLNTRISGIRVIRAFNQEKRENAEFRTRSIRLREDALTINRSWMTFFPFLSFFFGLGGILVWYVGGKFVLTGDPRYHVSLGTLVAFLAYLGMFYAPLSSLSQLSNWGTQVLTAAHRIFEILDETEETDKETQTVRLPSMKGCVEFRDVTFGYFHYLPVLRNVSFKVEAGEMVGIIGPSGSGKTTLINLICRFYCAGDGQVLIDDTDIRTIEKDDLRMHIGLVLQEPYLFRGTIAENIAYARPDAGREEIIRAAKAANAHDFVIRMPDGYETRIGEGGAGLSGGERQRVSIARAILRNPRILILDEATSSVDVETESLIREALQNLMRSRTTFVIAHRLSTLQNVDKVAVIQNGLLKQFGRPEDLMGEEGYYRRFVQTQSEMLRLRGVLDAGTGGSPAARR
jgi:ATP-binding cassette subfamily B protein